jgi:myosin heavy subunit
MSIRVDKSHVGEIFTLAKNATDEQLNKLSHKQKKVVLEAISFIIHPNNSKNIDEKTFIEIEKTLSSSGEKKKVSSHGAHKVILKMKSIFEKLFPSKVKLALAKVSPETERKILKDTYTSKINENSKNIATLTKQKEMAEMSPYRQIVDSGFEVKFTEMKNALSHLSKKNVEEKKSSLKQHIADKEREIQNLNKVIQDPNQAAFHSVAIHEKIILQSIKHTLKELNKAVEKKDFPQALETAKADIADQRSELLKSAAEDSDTVPRLGNEIKKLEREKEKLQKKIDAIEDKEEEAKKRELARDFKQPPPEETIKAQEEFDKTRAQKASVDPFADLPPLGSEEFLKDFKLENNFEDFGKK